MISFRKKTKIGSNKMFPTINFFNKRTLLNWYFMKKIALKSTKKSVIIFDWGILLLGLYLFVIIILSLIDAYSPPSNMKFFGNLWQVYIVIGFDFAIILYIQLRNLYYCASINQIYDYDQSSLKKMNVFLNTLLS